MANLPETPQWQEGIYQIETSDPVLGGTDGISNRQAKQLASRTSYLKQQVEKGSLDLDTHVKAADPHTQYAPKASPSLTGTPTAPTVAKTDNSTKLATTAHVKSVVADYAPLASPALTGTPTAPTAVESANNTQLATTAFVKTAIAALVASSPEALDTLNELAEALGNDPNFATTMTNALSGKQPLDGTLTALSGKSIPALLLYLGLPDVIPGRFLRRRFITSSGTYTPGVGVKMIRVRIVGAGGGGGAAGATNSGYTAIGGGGGAGGYSEITIVVGANFQPVSITIGSSGIPGGQSGYSGGAGGTTSFGSYCSASGGDGGAGTAATNNASYIMSGGAGGLGAGGEINAYGSSGSAAIMPAVNGGISGAGGASIIGSGPGGRVGNASGNDGVYGSGGSGGVSQGSTSTQYGGRGAAGIIIVEEYS